MSSYLPKIIFPDAGDATKGRQVGEVLPDVEFIQTVLGHRYQSL
jgi:hypothetical protein